MQNVILLGKLSFRSNRPEMLYKKGVFKNFTRKKRLWHRCFPVNFLKFLGTPFFNRTPSVAASALTKKTFNEN